MSRSILALVLLAGLLSGCSQPVNVISLPAGGTQGAQTVPSVTPTALFDAASSLPAATQTPSIITATPACAAPVTRLAIGDKVLVTVEDWDKLKLRSTPEVSTDNVLLELEQYSQLKILDGPVCAYSGESGYASWFWQVVVIPSGEVGWVAEGDYTHYFIQEY